MRIPVEGLEIPQLDQCVLWVDKASCPVLQGTKAGQTEEATLVTPNARGLTVMHLALMGSCVPDAQQTASDIVAKLAASDASKLSLRVHDAVKSERLASSLQCQQQHGHPSLCLSSAA